MSRVFTRTWRGPESIITGSDWLRYESKHGIDGLVRFKGHGVELLGVFATHPGTGQFRRFIADLKGKYDSICVWQIWNKNLPAILVRYGFKEHSDTEPDGEEIKGYRWEA